MDVCGGDRVKPKCYFTQATLPTFVDHGQPPMKKKPFSTVAKQSFSHTLDVVLLASAVDRFSQALASGPGTLHYARVHMKLSELVAGDFFDQYIKSGSILMLAQGRPGIDHVFALSDGVLRLEVDKPTYERLGLQGKPMPSEGRRHVKARYAIEINLRLPCMIRGHKGFDRIIWAFKNVLNHSVTWLFYDLQPRVDRIAPIAAHAPTLRSIEPEIVQLDNVTVPQFPNTVESDRYGRSTATELLEWLSLVTHLSPRMQNDDDIDGYLCRYSVPTDLSDSQEDDTMQDAHTLVKFRWQGFLPTAFISKIMLAALKASADDWFALSATSFSGEAYTTLKHNDGALIWEYVD
ncbi:hypothetical protein LTR08_008950 [Meristemomyces frigidus]|nr:hypothetical protein LTR08_008950 [Meristemomyces frigidus]